MTQQERQAVLGILTDYIRDDYGEASPGRRDLPRQAVDNARSESLRAFLEIHEALLQLVDPSHIRTRYTARSATGGYGLLYSRNPIISKAANRTNTEIQTVCLPTKARWQGFLEVYFSGHDEEPVLSTDIQKIKGCRAGQPVYRARNEPTCLFVKQTIDAFSRSSILG